MKGKSHEILVAESKRQPVRNQYETNEPTEKAGGNQRMLQKSYPGT